MMNFLAQASEGLTITLGGAAGASVVTALVTRWLMKRNGNGNGIQKAIDNHKDQCFRYSIEPLFKAIDDKLEILTKKDGKA